MSKSVFRIAAVAAGMMLALAARAHAVVITIDDASGDAGDDRSCHCHAEHAKGRKWPARRTTSPSATGAESPSPPRPTASRIAR